MPVLDCPQCDAKVRVPDDAAGKQARCPGCKELFRIPGGDEGRVTDRRSPEPPRPSRRPRDDDDDYDDRPRRRRDEDDDDDRPRRRSSRRDEDDDDYDRPRRKRRDTAKGDAWSWGWSPMIGITYGPIPVGLIFGLIVLGIMGIVALAGR